MKFRTLVDGLSNIINDYVENKLDPETENMFRKYLKKNINLTSFVQKSYEGKAALKNSYTVEAADDFEEKLAERIAGLDENRDQTEASAI